MKIAKEVADELLEIVPAVLYEYVLYEEDTDNEFLVLTVTCKDILGHPPEYFLENMNRFWEMVNDEDRERLQEEDRAANDEGVFFRSEVRFNHPSGKEIWIQISSRPTNRKVKNCVVWSGYIIDITAQKNLEQELKELASLDSLTNVLNRRAFLEKFQQEINRARRYQNTVCLLLCDLDHFKAINDKFGHIAGDSVLEAFVSYAKQSIRGSDFIGRIGGEEFAIVLPQSSFDNALLTAERLCKTVENTPLKIDGTAAKLTVSIGVAVLNSDSDTPSDALKRVDTALYQAKRTGRNKVVASDHLK